MSEDNPEIFITCEHHLFKDRYAECIRQWLINVAQNSEARPTLKFTESNIIDEGLPPISEILKYNGIIITGSFSRISQDEQWMKSLRHTIRLCFVNQVPIFAICFGFQILSQAFGSSYMDSPRGYNFGAYRYKIDMKALPFFKPYLEQYLSDSNSRTMFGFNQNEDVSLNNHKHNGHTQNHNNYNGHSNHNHNNYDEEKLLRSVIGIFSHNDVVTSLPNVDNIDFGDISENHRNELYKSLSEMVSTSVSSSERVPVVGMLVGNKSRTFIISVQLHPEFDTYSGLKFFNEILYLKLEQGTITLEQYEKNMKETKNSNSGYVYGKMALNLFMNGYIKPEY